MQHLEKPCKMWKNIEISNFIVYIKTDNIYKDIAKDVETRFHIVKLWIGQTIAKKKKEKVTRLMKDQLGGKIMTEFVGFREQT